MYSNTLINQKSAENDGPDTLYLSALANCSGQLISLLNWNRKLNCSGWILNPANELGWTWIEIDLSIGLIPQLAKNILDDLIAERCVVIAFQRSWISFHKVLAFVLVTLLEEAILIDTNSLHHQTVVLWCHKSFLSLIVKELSTRCSSRPQISRSGWFPLATGLLVRILYVNYAKHFLVA